MTVPTIAITINLYDGTGAPLTAGAVVFTATSPVTIGLQEFGAVPMTVPLAPGGLPVANLIPTDTAGAQPSSWAWQVAFPDVPGDFPAFTFTLPGGPAAFTAVSGAPGVFTWTATSALTVLPIGTGVQVTGGSLPSGVTAGTTYYVVGASGQTVQLAATPGGSPVALTSSGSGQISVVSYLLSGLAPVSLAQTYAGFLPLPAGTASAGMVPVATGSGSATTWQAQSGGGSSGTVAVSSGGTGLTGISIPWGLLAGGTTTTGALQQVGLGVAGQVLGSQGAGALPAWKYPVTEWFNVANYGASGNGSDQTTAIQAAISAAAAAGGGTVYFPKGLYSISSPLRCGSNFASGTAALAFRGAGWTSQLRLVNGANCYIFDFSNPSGGAAQFTPGILFADLYLDCNGANQTATSGGIYAHGGCYGVYDHLCVTAPYSAGIFFSLSGQGSTYGHHNRVTGSTFLNGYLAGSSTVPTGAGHAIEFSQSDENSIIGCTFQNNGNSSATVKAQVYDTSAGHQAISGCAFVTTSSPSTSVAMIKSDSNPSALQITACQFDSNTTGNQLELNGPDSTVTGCTFLSFGLTANSAVHISSSYCTITGNTFNPEGTGGLLGFAVVEASSGADHNVIASNTYAGTYGAGGPVKVFGANSVYQTFPLAPAYGGTGLTAAAPYAVLTGGTTSTGVLQQVSGLGASGQVLTSAGAGALPAWQTPSGGGGATPPESWLTASGDTTGVSDAANLAAAFTALASSGGRIRYAPGTYYFNTPVTGVSGVQIQGAGRGATILKGTSTFPNTAQAGLIQWTGTFGSSSPSQPVFTNVGISDLSFDMSAVPDTVINQINAVYQDWSQIRHVIIERIGYTGQAKGQCILFNGLGRITGGWSYDLTFRDIYALNGAGTVSTYLTAVTDATATYSGVTVENIYNLVQNITNIVDDRVAIVGGQVGTPTGQNTVRDISIRNIYTEMAGTNTGTVHGVKLDSGVHCVLRDISVRDVYFMGDGSPAAGQPFLTTIEASAYIQDVTVDGIYASNCQGIYMRFGRKDACPKIEIRNVVMHGCADATRVLEVYTESAPVGDELVVLENLQLNATGSGVTGIMLTSGSSAQGASGLVKVSGVRTTGCATGISTNLNEAGTTQASAWTNLKISDSDLSSAATPYSGAGGTYTALNVGGLTSTLASPALTGTPTAPTAAALTGGTQIATAAYADSAVTTETTRALAAEALRAPLASPALTGTPTAPTQAPGDNSTRIATTAFVAAAGGGGGSGATIDTTATDIQPSGTQTAGSSGLAADARHAHPATAFSPAAYGMILSDGYDPNAASGNQSLTAGSVYLRALPVYAACTLTNILLLVQVTPVGASTGSFVGVYSPAGTLLAQSADYGLLSVAAHSIPLLSPAPLALTPGTTPFVWIAILTNFATTQLGVRKWAVSDSTVANMGTTTATYRSCVNGTGLTALPSTITPSANSLAGSFPIWVGGS